MRLKDIRLRPVFDSRSEPTIEVELETAERRVFRAKTPSGKSRGRNEAQILEFTQAKAILQKFKKNFIGKKFVSLKDCDKQLLILDPSPQKIVIGGNLALGISTACGRALSHERRLEFWQLLSREFFGGVKPAKPPLIFSNLINGGVHASTNLAFQEYLAVIKIQSPAFSSVSRLIKIFKILGAELKQSHKMKQLPTGDEGGYALDFKNSFEPIAALEKLKRGGELNNLFRIAIDAAANNFCRNGFYFIDGKKISSRELEKKYRDLAKKSKLLMSIEDPFAEDDAESFRELKKRLPKKVWIVGDDLTVTQSKLIDKHARAGAIDAVIIKPNQVGTITETCDAITVAKKFKLKFIISHRSGETDDNLIIELARASAAPALKIGAPTRERIMKYNELIRLYEK